MYIRCGITTSAIAIIGVRELPNSVRASRSFRGLSRHDIDHRTDWAWWFVNEVMGRSLAVRAEGMREMSEMDNKKGPNDRKKLQSHITLCKRARK